MAGILPVTHQKLIYRANEVGVYDSLGSLLNWPYINSIFYVAKTVLESEKSLKGGSIEPGWSMRKISNPGVAELHCLLCDDI